MKDLSKHIRNSLIILVVILLGAAIFLYLKPINKGHVTIQCKYMAYSCGTCYPQYQIKRIHSSKDCNVEDIINKDLYVVFKNKTTEKKLDKQIMKHCYICYDYFFKGDLKYFLLKKYYYMEPDTAYVQMSDSSCCDN